MRSAIHTKRILARDPSIIPGYVRLAPGIIWAAPAVMALADARHKRLSAARSYVLLPHERQIDAVTNPQVLGCAAGNLFDQTDVRVLSGQISGLGQQRHCDRVPGVSASTPIAAEFRHHGK